MSQPRLICQGTLKYWIQQEWYRLTAVILASNENYSLTLTKLSLQSWLSNPSHGVILDMSLSSVLAMESASVGSKDGVYLVLLFTKRSTHVLSAVSEQDRIQWQSRFEQIIGEEWKFRVTIPCQQDLKQECQGVLRFNTKRRTIVVTYTQENKGLPAVLYHWTLKSIKSFGANDDMLVLDTSSSTEAGRCYFCFNTTQADQILTVFREATGILPQSCHVHGGRLVWTRDVSRCSPGTYRSSARFADINRVKKAIERNSQSQLAKRGVSSEVNRADEDEIHYEVADDEDTLNRRSTPGQHSSDPTRNEGNLGVNSPPNLIPDRSAEIESRLQASNPARLYHFPSPEADDRAVHSHMHAVPVMEDRMALAIKQRSSPLPHNPAKNPRAVTPQNEFPEARKVKKFQDKPPTNEPRKKRSRSRNAFRILSGRSTPRGTEDTSQYATSSRASSRPTSPTPSFIHRALSKLKGPFHRSRENILSEEEEISRVRSESKQRIDYETKSQFSHMKRNYTAVPATSQSTQNNPDTQPIQQLDRPIPPRHKHIPKHPPQPIIVQHPQPIQPLHTPASPPVPQPGHFVPSQHPNTMAYMNNQVLTPPNYMVASNISYPMQQLYPNQLIVNPHQVYNQQMVWEHIATTPIQYNEPNPYNKLSARKPVQTQTTQTNKQTTHTNTSDLNKNAATQIVPSVPHRIIDSSSPLPLSVSNTPVVSQPSFKVTPGNNQPRISSSQHIPALLPSSPVTPPAVTTCQDDDISQTDSGNYDHLSPSQVAKNLNSAVFSGLPDILQPTNKSADTAVQSADLQPSPSTQRRVPPGGQLTPLALILTEQNQQGLKPNSEYRGIRRQDAFRYSGPTPQHKNKPPIIPPKPTLLFPKEGVSTEDMDGGDVSRSPGMMDSSANAEVSKSSHLLPPQLPTTSPSYLQDPNLSTEC